MLENTMRTDLDYYYSRRDALLADQRICVENRSLFRDFFAFEETKLKRKSSLPMLDKGCVLTLLAYVTRLKNVNAWFGNKPLIQITESDIRSVYDGLEDGKIVTARGTRFVDRRSYYSKVFKSKLFAMAGKLEIASSVIEYDVPNEAVVRFVLEDDVRRIAQRTFRRDHLLLLWVAFDIGENINSLLNLTPADFARRLNPNTHEPEYLVRLRKPILKRTRTPRTEVTLYRETTELLDAHLAESVDGHPIFSFGYQAAREFLARAARSAGVKCQPSGDDVTWKDLRSGMACDLARKGWSRDEINKRLGHRPSSREIDKYLNYLAIDSHQPKVKSHQFEMANLQERLNQSTAREKLADQRLAHLQETVATLEQQMLRILLERPQSLANVEQAITLATKCPPG
jgi:hypothetical protein